MMAHDKGLIGEQYTIKYKGTLTSMFYYWYINFAVEGLKYL
jgi:hypothetical protein